MAVIYPSTSLRKRSPSSTDAVSPSSSGAGGTTVLLQIVQGHVRVAPSVRVMPAPGASTLPVSSNARLFTLTVPDPVAVHVNVHDAEPVAALHVVPPSVEISTPDTIPPPASVAVPAI